MNTNPLTLNSTTQELTYMESAQKFKLDVHQLSTLQNQKLKQTLSILIFVNKSTKIYFLVLKSVL